MCSFRQAVNFVVLPSIPLCRKQYIKEFFKASLIGAYILCMVERLIKKVRRRFYKNMMILKGNSRDKISVLRKNV